MTYISHMSEYKDIGSYIDRTYKVVRHKLISRFKEAGIKITPEQWVILSKLNKENMYQTDLANMSFRDKPTVSRIVDLLSKNKLVERVQDKNDGRKFHVRITSDGKEIVRKAEPIVDGTRKLGWKNLSEEEYETLIFLLDKIFQNYTEDE